MMSSIERRAGSATMFCPASIVATLSIRDGSVIFPDRQYLVEWVEHKLPAHERFCKAILVKLNKIWNDDHMPYDPTIYRGSAAYYARGRPPYSRSLASTLAAEVGLDGQGRLLDVGCGPGTLTIALADRFEESVGLDPDAEMLAAAPDRQIEEKNMRWVQPLAEDTPALGLGNSRLVPLAQSSHGPERELAAKAVFEILDPGGALALTSPAHEARPHPAGPEFPP